MKIVLVSTYSNLSDNQKRRLESIGRLKIIQGIKIPQYKLIPKIKDAEILIVSPSSIKEINYSLLSKLKKLKFISLLAVGYDWVDVEAAMRLNIQISNVKGANSEAVAEHIWGMILDLSKRITEYDRDIREFGVYDFNKYKGKEVYGKTIGIIGTGNIGRKVARIAKAFNMRILGTNNSGKPVKDFELTDLDTLLRISDIIVVCVPLNDLTKNMISSREFSLTKQGAILINCAREMIVNKKSLLKAIKKGKVFGYGMDIDVMRRINISDEILYEKRVLVTGHNAGATLEAENRLYEMTIKNIISFVKGKPINLIT